MGEDVVRREAVDRWAVTGCELAEATELGEISSGDGDGQDTGLRVNLSLCRRIFAG